MTRPLSPEHRQQVVEALRIANNGCAYLTADEGAKVEAALALMEAEEEQGWIPVSDRLPDSGKAILASFTNTYGKRRTVRAYYAAKHSHSAESWEDVDDEWLDYDEAGNPWAPVGWYEAPVIGEALSFISPTSDGEVTHWQPLPAPPVHPVKQGSAT